MVNKHAGKNGSEFWVYWFPVIMYMSLIFFMSAQSSFPIKPPLIPHIDKICHWIEFAGLGFLLVRAFANTQHPKVRQNALLLALIITILFGMSDEIHQLFVPCRQADMFDLIADTFGAVFGILGFLFFDRLILLRRGRRG